MVEMNGWPVEDAGWQGDGGMMGSGPRGMGDGDGGMGGGGWKNGWGEPGHLKPVQQACEPASGSTRTHAVSSLL